MKDTREFQRKAKELVDRKEAITVRLLLKNGKLIEQSFKPIVTDKVVYYNGKRQEYLPKKGYFPLDIYTIELKKMLKAGYESKPLYSTSGGSIISELVTLFNCGYQIC